MNIGEFEGVEEYPDPDEVPIEVPEFEPEREPEEVPA